MRLSVLALLIALPAAAYAAVCPQQHSMDDCGERNDYCSDEIPCCGRLECRWNGFTNVRLMSHLLIRIGY